MGKGVDHLPISFFLIRSEPVVSIVLQIHCHREASNFLGLKLSNSFKPWGRALSNSSNRKSSLRKEEGFFNC
ncbi:hypothetical protein A946_10300 [Methylacidiphilum kamchatkense Kam1]|uniref:Uncharacterized protein n=1 Tax=Methylacidiphilum kamchatkense Kam1 TaxID=1202785 RepID=A0ABR4ZUT3_9BACT|nr:hypothetical protein A946_10300 [Methylacidiphilum kamchatkense Kam1]